MLQIKKFPDIPVYTRDEAQESRPHPEEPRFHLIAREEGSFPFEVGKEFPAFSSHLKRRRSPQERREELQGPATIPRVPQMSQSIPGKPVFPALPRPSSQGSTHTTVARGTALWESLVGKPRGKASRESHRSLDPSEGKRDTAATAREESARAGPHSRRGLTPWGDSEVLQVPCQHWRGILSNRHRLHTRSEDRHRRERNPERPPSNSQGDWPFLRPPERVPDVPVVSQEHLP